MRFSYSLALVAMSCLAAPNLFAQEPVVTLSPEPGNYETLPSEFVITVDGPASIKKNIVGGNPLLVTDPAGTNTQWTGTYSGNTVTCKANSQAKLDLDGEYTVTVRANSFTCVWEDGTTSGVPATTFTYKVGDPYAVKVSISPAPGEYEELPTEFVLTFDGPESIKKNIIGGNPLLITDPAGTKTQVTGTYNGNTITCKVPASVKLDLSGDYTVTFRDKSVNYYFPDLTSPIASTTEDFTYTVKGQGGGGQDEPQPVAYDIEVKGFQPSLTPLDLEMKTLETLQIVFNMPNLGLDEDANATVTISGPDYKQTSQLKPNMPTTGNFKANFQDPKYNGTYTLTIPQGVVGDAEWLADHSKGHANAAVNFEFTVVGGQEAPAVLGVTSTFNPIVTPGSESKVTTLTRVFMEFESAPFYAEGTQFKVTYKEDLSSTGNGSSYGTASIEQGSENELIIVFNPAPKAKGQYLMTVPAGSFWDQTHADNAEAGQINGNLNLAWYLFPETVKVDVISHTPASNAKVAAFYAHQPGIIINTNNNDAVAKLDVEVTRYEYDNDSAMPRTIVNATSTAKTEDGAICWINDSDTDIALPDGYWYEVMYTIYDAEGNVLGDGLFEFDGDVETSVITINADAAQKGIYNLQGIRINRAANELPAGLYIIDGKKTIIRK